MIASITFQWFHWFDLFVIFVLGLGIFLGRNHTALEEIIGLINWFFILVICAFLYHYPAIWIAKATGMRPDVAALLIYPLTVVGVYFALSGKRKAWVRTTLKMEVFGHREYHVAMLAGMLRTFTILFIVMAWINGRYVTEKDLRDYDAFCQENFGSIRMPVLSTVQQDIFVDSYVGRFTRNYLSLLLVTPLEPPPAPPAPELKPKEGKEVDLNGKGGPESPDVLIKEMEERGKKTNAPPASPVPKLIYHQLSLKGISGSGSKRLALINNQALHEGETDFVKVENHRVRVHITEIHDSYVLVQLDNSPEVVELQLANQQTNSITGISTNQTTNSVTPADAK